MVKKMNIVDIICIVIVVLLLIVIMIKNHIKEKEKNKDYKIDKKKRIKCNESMNNENNNNENNKTKDFFDRHYKKIWIVFIIILFFSVIFKFGEIPTYIGVDEAGMAYDAFCIAEYGTDRYQNSYPLYLTNFGGGQSSLYAYLAAVCIKLFGFNEIAYRLPALIVYLISVAISYLFISKSKNKKMALLFVFLIITCPWNIFNARMALDCNLFAGLLMIDLYWLNKAEKNIHFIIAGIFIGVTLYTYALSWITVPLFLIVWSIYVLYIKRIKFRQLIILGIPIFVLATPLIYFLLLNLGIVKQTQISIFTLPLLPEFRGGEIAISNIWKTGIESIKTIFTGEGTIYLMYIPLFLIGYIIEFSKMLLEIKNKKYGVSTLMVIAFTTIFIGLLTTRIPTPNKANVLYIPILYFVTVAILEVCDNSKLLLFIFIILVTASFINYEYYYYKIDGVVNTNWYEDIYLKDITTELENDNKTKNLEKYLLVFKSSPYIYNMLVLQPSPEEFCSTQETRLYNNGTLKQVGKILEYNYLYIEKEIETIDLTKEDYVFVITNNYKNAINYLKENGYNSKCYGYYEILTKET